MSVITILNQGTDNSSTNRAGSSNCELVISKIAALLAGTDGEDWILNEGAGTQGLRDQVGDDRRKAAVEGRERVQGGKAGRAAGILVGKGVDWNVNRSVDFAKKHLEHEGAGEITVNLAGHSRGSITCYKIARALRDNQDTQEIRVNIFAIDPVPGNTGVLNHKNWRNIALGGI